MKSYRTTPPLKTLTLLLSTAIAQAALHGADLYLSPNGTGVPEGARTVANIAAAKAAVRALRAEKPAEPVTVWIAPGIWYLPELVKFGQVDSGAEGAPVTWRALEPGRTTFSTGRRMPAALFGPVTDPKTANRLDPAARGQVVELDLAAAGIRNTGPYPDHFADDTALFRLYFNGTRMPNSRWPNGAEGYTTMETVLDSGDFRGNQPHGGTFRYRDDRPQRWLAALRQGGVWLRGFWRVPWVVEGIKVKEIDQDARTITFAVSTPNGIGSKYTPLVDGTRAGDGKENWYALNLVEEIDLPGEWAIDFATRKLYFWPPQPLADNSVVIADNRDPVVAFSGASHIVLRDIVLRHSLGSGVSIRNGQGVTIAACEIQDQGEHGVLIRGGSGHTVTGCEIHDTGLSGVDLLGGDRRTLTPSGHRIVNNHIHHIGLSAPVAAIVAGYGPGAAMVGALIAHNRIHDGPSAAVRYAGNDNEIAWNEVYHIGMGSSDLGAFYTNSGWTTQGNVLHHNFVHHCENAQAFYLDDGDSGDTVAHNIVYKAQSGAFLGGGHDNVFRQNVFVACERGIHADARGVSRGYTPDDKRLGGDLASVPFRQPPWSDKYPGLVTLPDRDTTLPSGVVFEDTLVVDCRVDVRRSGTGAELAGITFGRLAEGDLSLFRDPASLDFGFRDIAAVHALLPGFEEIDMAKIGLQADGIRRSIPERDLGQITTRSTARKEFDSQVDIDASNRMGPPRAAMPFISQQELDYARPNPAEPPQAPATPQGVGAAELNVRGGLPRFFAKARAGQPVTVAYFGGSITAHEGWRPRSFSALQALFPDCPMTMVNACVGGSGSIVGVFRADKDLVAKNPDLVLIEFAVNDSGDARKRPDDVRRALEGIIRKVRIADPAADICLVYTLQTANVDALRKGRYQEAAQLHEEVAAWYNLPSIHVGPALVRMIDAGEAVFFGSVADAVTGRDTEGRLVITEDNTHPVIPTGHALYADIVVRSLQALDASAPTPAAAPLPAPILGESWELAKTLPVDGNARFAGDWVKLTAADGPACMRFGKRFYEWFPYLYRTAQPGASVTVRFTGTMIGIKGIDGPDSGIVELRVDDRKPVRQNHFTVYCTRWAYIGESLPELPAGEHTVSWTLSAEKPDKQAILASYYKPDNDRDLRENPEKYAPVNFSVGEIMIIGDVLPPAD